MCLRNNLVKIPCQESINYKLNVKQCNTHLGFNINNFTQTVIAVVEHALFTSIVYNSSKTKSWYDMEIPGEIQRHYIYNHRKKIGHNH